MTHAPPVPEGNQSPYPIAEPPHEKTPATDRRDHAHWSQAPDASLVAGLAAGTVAVLGAVGLIAYLFTRKGDSSPVAKKGTSAAVRKPVTRKATAAARKSQAAKAKPRRAVTRVGSGDDPGIRGPRDASLIALGEDHEVAYWTKKFGVDRAALQAAVDAAGNGARAVAAHLAKA